MLECEFCKSKFKNVSGLNAHKKTAQYCIKIRGENSTDIFKCNICNKVFTTKRWLLSHQKKCGIDTDDLQTQIDQLKTKLSFVLKESEQKDQQIKDLQEMLVSLTSKETEKVCELQDKLQELAKLAIDQKNEVISRMVKKYVKKQPRQQFDCSNVLYILTTPSLKKDRRYILGKAKNLTSRLSTYNKTDEHEVVYYQDCGDEESMNALEPFVFKKLSEYREQANRERFILPNNNNIDLFIDTIKKCFEFLK